MSSLTLTATTLELFLIASDPATQRSPTPMWTELRQSLITSSTACASYMARRCPSPPRSAAPPPFQTRRHPPPHPPHRSQNVPKRLHLQEGLATATRRQFPSGMTSLTLPRRTRSIAPVSAPIRGHKAAPPWLMHVSSSEMIQKA